MHRSRMNECLFNFTKIELLTPIELIRQICLTSFVLDYNTQITNETQKSHHVIHEHKSYLFYQFQ